MSNWQFQIIKALRRKTKSSVINDQICNRRKQMNASRRAAAKNRQGVPHFCGMRSSMLHWLLWPTILCAALRENKQETQAAITDDIMFEWPPLIKTLGCQLYADRIAFMSSVNEIQVPNFSVKSYIPVAVCTLWELSVVNLWVLCLYHSHFYTYINIFLHGYFPSLFILCKQEGLTKCLFPHRYKCSNQFPRPRGACSEDSERTLWVCCPFLSQ